MINRRASITVLTFALAGSALTACGGADVSPNPAPQAQAAAPFISDGASMPNVGAQYDGTVNDSLYGSGRIYAELVQYHNAVGGNVTFTYGSTEFQTPHVFTLTGTTLTGTGESATLSLVPCTVSETATNGDHQLNGSYKAVRGCSGDNGSFRMKEYCRYATNSLARAGLSLKTCGASAPRNFASRTRAAASSISNDAGVPNLSGEFVGTVTDSLYGNGRMYAELVQYHNAVGGTIIFEYGSTVFITPNAFLSKGTTLTGKGESATLSGVPCTISESATNSNSRLKGSYKAVRGCSGESGTFAVKEYCKYVTDSNAEPRFALKYCFAF